jgi:predicted small lipoprotein YifL
MNRNYKLALLIVLALFLGACGQRGPLYLPEQAPTNEPSSEKAPEARQNPSLKEGQ